MTLTKIIIYWVALGFFGNLLVASIVMLWTGKGLPPFSHVRVPAIVSTFLNVVAITGTLFFGQPELLKNTLTFFLP